MSNNIVDIFNTNAKNFIITQNWMVEDKSLTNFDTRKFSIPVLTSEMRNEYLNIDIESNLVIAIKNEITQDLLRLFTKKLFTTKKFDYLDLRHLISPSRTAAFTSSSFHIPVRPNLYYTDKLIDMILSNNYKNIITTSLISSELEDSPSFNYHILKKDLSIGGVTYNRGFIGDKTAVYLDPYMKFNDDIVCLFNQVEFNIGKMKAYEAHNIYSLSPRIIIEYDIDYSVDDSKLIFVIENENSESFRQLKIYQRDEKIDNILNIGF